MNDVSRGLYRVTLTGVDDAVAQRDLAELAVEFPFVEFGILMSKSREGQPRYPSLLWRMELRLALEERGVAPPLSAHLCGAYAREAMAGYEEWRHAVALRVQRVQLNGFSDYHLPMLRVASDLEHVTFIMQVMTMRHIHKAFALAKHYPNVEALFDPSGGTGLRGGRWPPDQEWLHWGFAGGIGPDNVESVLTELGSARRAYWIDMETGVRDANDKFSLDKAYEVLRKARPFVSGGAA